MSETGNNPHGTQPPPVGHSLPRRTSPANSVTLRHHRVARDASRRASTGSVPPGNTTNSTSSARGGSSGASHDTGHSDPKTWFDQSNKNPTATFDSHAMDSTLSFSSKIRVSHVLTRMQSTRRSSRKSRARPTRTNHINSPLSSPRSSRPSRAAVPTSTEA